MIGQFIVIVLDINFQHISNSSVFIGPMSLVAMISCTLLLKETWLTDIYVFSNKLVTMDV